MYIWRRDGNGGYARESIFQSENETELDFYGRNQRVYDAFSNCWDLCDDFGVIEPDEFDPNDDSDFPSPTPLNPSPVTSPSHVLRLPSPAHSQFAPEDPHPQLTLHPASL